MSNKPEKAYVLGQNIAYSKSPLIHNHWLKKYGIEGSYAIKDISPDQLENIIKAWRNDPDFAGSNVTIPYKKAVIPYLDRLDDAAITIGAVNTIYAEDGKLIGTNTDAYGFMTNLKSQLSVQEFETLKTKPVLVLGAGGAARAILYGLIESGITTITLSNRSRKNAEELAAHYQAQAKIEVLDWDNRLAARECYSVINTTSLGMAGRPDLDLPLEKLDSLAIVVDIIYNPLMTDVLQNASAAGMTTVTGIGMLIHQAAPAFTHFFKHKIPQEDISADQDLERLVLGQ